MKSTFIVTVDNHEETEPSSGPDAIDVKDAVQHWADRGHLPDVEVQEIEEPASTLRIQRSGTPPAVIQIRKPTVKDVA